MAKKTSKIKINSELLSLFSKKNIIKHCNTCADFYKSNSKNFM